MRMKSFVLISMSSICPVGCEPSGPPEHAQLAEAIAFSGDRTVADTVHRVTRTRQGPGLCG